MKISIKLEMMMMMSVLRRIITLIHYISNIEIRMPTIRKGLIIKNAHRVVTQADRQTGRQSDVGHPLNDTSEIKFT